MSSTISSISIANEKLAFDDAISCYNSTLDDELNHIEPKYLAYLQQDIKAFTREIGKYVSLFPTEASRIYPLACQSLHEQLEVLKNDNGITGFLSGISFFQTLLRPMSLLDDKDMVHKAFQGNLFSLKPLHLVAMNEKGSSYIPFLADHEVYFDELCGAPHFATPLSIAISQRNSDVFRMLLAYSALEDYKEKGAKAQINQADDDFLGNTPLIKAICQDALYDVDGKIPVPIASSMTGALIAHGANINQVNKLGQSPLHYALLFQDFTLANYLIDKGALLFAKDIEGLTPFHYALFRHDDVSHQVQMLRIRLDKGKKQHEDDTVAYISFLANLKEETTKNGKHQIIDAYQKDRINTLLVLSKKLDELYYLAKHNQKAPSTLATKYGQARHELFMHFSHLSKSISFGNLPDIFADFITFAVDESEHHPHFLAVDKILKNTKDHLLSSGQASKGINLPFFELLFSSQRAIYQWIDALDKESFKAFITSDNGRERSPMAKLFLAPENNLALEVQIQMMVRLIGKANDLGLCSEAVCLNQFKVFLTGFRPLHQKMTELNDDRWPVWGQNQLAKEKYGLLSEQYQKRFEALFALFAKTKMRCTPLVRDYQQFANQLNTQKQLLQSNSSHLNTLKRRRRHWFDGLMALVRWLKDLFTGSSALDKQETVTNYIGSMDALASTDKSLAEHIKSYTPESTHGFKEAEKSPFQRDVNSPVNLSSAVTSQFFSLDASGEALTKSESLSSASSEEDDIGFDSSCSL